LYCEAVVFVHLHVISSVKSHAFYLMNFAAGTRK
jgi:hypothetical protein